MSHRGPMSEKLTSLVACGIALALLAAVNAGLVAYTLVANDRREAMHESLLEQTAIAASWERAYGKLLERVGGSDVPSVPPHLPAKPNSNTGDK